MHSFRPTRSGRPRAGAVAALLAGIVLSGCMSQASTTPDPTDVTTGATTDVTTGATTGVTTGVTTANTTSRDAAPNTARPTTVPPRSSSPSKASAAITVSSVPGDTCASGHCYSVGQTRSLPTGVAPESSGIVASQKSKAVFFVVDDGTGADRIVAVRSDGSSVGDVAVQGMSTGNAEALAAGACGDRAGRCFYIGDIGDNARKRSHITVYRIDEPAVSPLPSAPVPSDEWQYTYPDGPHNAEAMVVDPKGSVLVITKSAPDPTTGEVPPHRIYRGAPGGGVLRFVSSFTPPQPARRVQSLFTGNVVTDASFTPGRMLVLTYDQVVEYLAPTRNADPATFPSWPHHELPDPPMIQTEGIAADITGCGYEVTSEEGPGGTRAGLAAVACR